MLDKRFPDINIVARQKALGAELRRLRLEKRLRQQDLVNELGLSAHRTIWLWESGRRLPPLWALILLARRFDKTLLDLIAPLEEGLREWRGKQKVGMHD